MLGPADLPDFLELTVRRARWSTRSPSTARAAPTSSRACSPARSGAASTAASLVAACHVGANLVPVECTPDDARAFAERALTRPRSVITIVGLQDQVWPLWDAVSDAWGPARETRWDQPHLELAGPPLVEPDPEVRRTTPDDFAVLYPACVAMYTEEVGVDPEADGGAPIYRSRVRQLIGLGLVLRPDRGRPGGVQGRGRARHAVRRADPGRLGGARPAGSRAWPPAGWPRWPRRAAATSPRWCRCTPTSGTSRPAAPTSASASSSPAPSPP